MDGLLYDALSCIVTVAESIVILFLLYYYYVSVYGWRKHKEDKEFNPEKRFALITAAHNEEAVIRYHLESLKRLNYPAELFDIYVIADNCTDATAAVARGEGALVYERFSPKRGKGYALEWMFAKLFEMDEQKYDAICLFDADNVVSSNFLLEMNSKLKKGYRSIQGYLDTKNPNDSWVTACYATAYWSMNRMWQLARYNKGLSNALGGTGVCLEYELLKEYGWGATCLTEDLEFTMKLLMNGIKTSWAHEAKVYDEKPVYFSQTWRQRTRWLQGHWDVAFRYMIPLIKKGWREKKWYPVDGAIYLFQPFLITIMFLTFLFAGAAYLSPVPLYESMLTVLTPRWYWWVFGLVGYCYPMLGLILEGAPRRAYFYYITYPFYGLTWFPVTLWGLFQHKNQDNWAHTRHVRAISINSLESGQAAVEAEIAAASSAPALAVVPKADKVKIGGVRRSLVPNVALASEGQVSEAEMRRPPGKPTYPALVVNRPVAILKPVEVVKATINQDHRVTVASGESR